MLATSRFLEYFAETASPTLTGTTPAAVSSKGFVPGTVQVRGAGAAATLYKDDVDYLEDDKNGTIARIAGGAIADGAVVEVEFVARR